MTPAPASGPTFIHPSDHRAVLDVSGAFVLIVALALGAANELFNLGIFNDDYPVVDFDGGPGGSSQTESGTFGEYVKQTGLITLIAGVVGAILFYFIRWPEDECERDENGSSSDKEYGCPECGKRFVARSAVEQHYRDIHT